MSEKQLEKLNNIVELLETDRASKDEVAQAFEVVLGVITQMKEDMEQIMAQNKGEMTEEMEARYKKMVEMHDKLEATMKKMEAKMGNECKEVRQQCMAKIKEVEEMIPAPADFSAIEARVSEVESKIPTIPEIPQIEPLQKDISNLQEDIKEIRKDIEELKKRPATVVGGGTSAMAVARSFKYIFHTEEPVGAIDGVNATYTVQNGIWAIIGFTLNGESIAELPNYTFANKTITFSSAIPADYSGKDFEVKYIGT